MDSISAIRSEIQKIKEMMEKIEEEGIQFEDTTSQQPSE